MTGTQQTGPGAGQWGPRSTPGSPDPQQGQPEHDPTTPLPDDPQQHEPMRDPPLQPERDQKAGGSDPATDREATPGPSPDGVVFDENESAK